MNQIFRIEQSAGDHQIQNQKAGADQEVQPEVWLRLDLRVISRHSMLQGRRDSSFSGRRTAEWERRRL
jgi:hypothetical protein